MCRCDQNFICQKVQHFQADSEYLGKINTKKKFQILFQCLALPKDPQSFGTYKSIQNEPENVALFDI